MVLKNSTWWIYRLWIGWFSDSNSFNLRSAAVMEGVSGLGPGELGRILDVSSMYLRGGSGMRRGREDFRR